jgi:ribosomal protein S1
MPPSVKAVTNKLAESRMTENISSPEQPKQKDRISGKVLKTTLAGALIDIGAEQPAILPISQLKKESVRRVEDVVKTGDTVEAWVRSTENKSGRIELTLIEPILMEWRDIKKGMALTGKVGRIEKFGAFIELGAERPGLVHVSEMADEYVRSTEDFVKLGQEVEVHVLEVNKRKKQIKLSMKGPAVEEIIEEEEAEEPAPTAMESALRKARLLDDEPAEVEMTNEKTTPEEKPEKQEAMDDILARTLEQRVKSA